MAWFDLVYACSDTEEWGEICIGCAGGGDTSIEIDLPAAAGPPGLRPFTVIVLYVGIVIM